MSLTKITTADTADKGVVGLPDTPNLSVTALQKKFDELATDVIIPKFNELSTELDELEIGDRIGSEDDGSGKSKITNIKLDEDGRMVVSTDGGEHYTSASSSGHIIVNGAGVEFPAENRLQFSDNVVVTDYPKSKKTFLSIPSGQKGDRGESATISVGAVETSEYPFVENVGSDTDAIFNFGIPTGEKGPAATVRIGSVIGGDVAEVTNSGSTSDAVFNFVLPKGDKGDKGAGLVPKGKYNTLAELKSEHPTGKDGDCYVVGDDETSEVDILNTKITNYEKSGYLKSSNIISGTDDFSGDWANANAWAEGGAYEGLTVKKRSSAWNGIYKTFKAESGKTYTFSAYIKASASVSVNGYSSLKSGTLATFSANTSWQRISFSVPSTADSDSANIRLEMTTSGTDLYICGIMISENGDTSYAPCVPSNIELQSEIDALMPTSYISSGLSYENCAYVGGGYFKIGNLVVVNIRVRVTGSSAKVNGLPSYSATTNIAPCYAYCTETASDRPTGFVSKAGTMDIFTTTSGREYMFNAMYLI